VKENSGDKLTGVRAGGRRRPDWQARPKSACGACRRVLHVCQPHMVRRGADIPLLLSNSDETNAMQLCRVLCASFTQMMIACCSEIQLGYC
jgi:hypothetical protein